MTARFSLILLAALLALLPSKAAAADLVVDAASTYLVDASINGHPVRLRVDPAASGYIVLNPAAVARIGLRRSMTRSATQIGPVRLTGGSKVADVVVGGVSEERRIVWIDQPAVERADGTIAPADIGYDRVTFRLGDARADDRAYDLPMEFRPGAGLFFPLELGEHRVFFQFTLIKANSMATAAAAAHLAALYGGAWVGDVRPETIGFGVVRPVRALRLARPASLNGLELDALLVRTGDHRGNLDLPPEPGADPEEVVVSAGSRQRARFEVTVGRDLLSACSSMVWDNRTRRLTLTCARRPGHPV